MNRIPPITARRRSKTDRFFAIVGRWAKLVQSLTIIFGVVVGVISIIDGQLEKRLTRTLDFNKDYNENIRSDFIDLATQFNGLVESKGGFPQGDDERKAVVLSFFAENLELQKKINNVLDFYDTLYVCVKHRSCDRNSALELFGKSINDTFQLFGYYILSRREVEHDPALGQGLENLYNLSPEPSIYKLLP